MQPFNIDPVRSIRIQMRYQKFHEMNINGSSKTGRAIFIDKLMDDLNSKLEYRNSKQILNPKREILNVWDFLFRILELFRISCFGFLILIRR